MDKTFICPGCNQETTKKAYNHIMCCDCSAQLARETLRIKRKTKKNTQNQGS